MQFSNTIKFTRKAELSRGVTVPAFSADNFLSGLLLPKVVPAKNNAYNFTKTSHN
jgi:hypothetical protein